MRSNTKQGEAVDRFGLPTVKYIQLPMVHTKREPVSRSGTNRLLTNDAYERLLVDLTYPNNSKFDSYQYFVEKFCFFSRNSLSGFTIASKIKNELCKMNEIQSCEMRLRNKQVSTKLETPLFQNGYICFVSLLFRTSARAS